MNRLRLSVAALATRDHIRHPIHTVQPSGPAAAAARRDSSTRGGSHSPPLRRVVGELASHEEPSSSWVAPRRSPRSGKAPSTAGHPVRTGGRHSAADG